MERHKRLGAARPYAKALFELSCEQDRQASWERALEALALMVSAPAFAGVLHHPRMGGARLLEFSRAVCAAFLATSLQRNLLALLVEAGRLECAPEIFDLYRARRRAADGITAVEISSAYPLEEDEQRHLADWLRSYLGHRPELTVCVDRKLLGGVRVRAGDQVIDASVRGRLRSLLGGLTGGTRTAPA